MKNLNDIGIYYKGMVRGWASTTETLPSIADAHDFRKCGRLSLGSGRTDVDALLLYDADRLVKAALASYLASSRLMSGGHATWSEITRYYAQFHTIGALLRFAGLAPIFRKSRPRSLLLLRCDEENRAYSIIHPSDSCADNIGFKDVGSHLTLWHLFGQVFQAWTDETPHGEAEILGDDEDSFGMVGYRLPSALRNEANYLQQWVGRFFSETDFTGLQESTVSTARIEGNWDWLRDDATPYGYDGDPPEAIFTDEQLTWLLLKYALNAVFVANRDSELADQYEWIVQNLDAFPDLSNHILEDIRELRKEVGL